MKKRRGLRAWLETHYKRKSFMDPTQNYSHLPQPLVKRFTGKKILNIGAGKERLGESVITLDRFDGADIIGDAQNLPIRSSSMDLAISIAVLEHLKEPDDAIREMERILNQEGELYVEIPFIQPYHASPQDYYRATLSGLKHWCRRFKEITSGVCVGPGSAVAWLEIEYVKLWFGKIPVVGLLIELIFRAWSLPLKYLDRFLIGKSEAHIGASAIYFHGKKV